MTRNGGGNKSWIFICPPVAASIWEMLQFWIQQPVEFLAIAAEPYLEGFTIQVLVRREVETRLHRVTGDRLTSGSNLIK